MVPSNLEEEIRRVRNDIAQVEHRISAIRASLNETNLPLHNAETIEASCTTSDILITTDEDNHRRAESNVVKNAILQVLEKRLRRMSYPGITDTPGTRLLSDLQSTLSQQLGNNSDRTKLKRQAQSYRVDVYSGEMCSISQSFVVDGNTTFGLLMQHICEYWRLETSHFRLCVNVARTSYDWIEKEYQKESNVVSTLLELSRDHALGFGQNGHGVDLSVGVVANNKTNVRTSLPPLYLVKISTKSKRERVSGIDSKQNRLVDVPRIRDLFHQTDSNNAGMLDFDQMYSLTCSYFHGLFIPLLFLQKLFNQFSHVDTSELQYEASLISFKNAVNLLQQILRELWEVNRDGYGSSIMRDSENVYRGASSTFGTGAELESQGFMLGSSVVGHATLENSRSSMVLNPRSMNPRSSMVLNPRSMNPRSSMVLNPRSMNPRSSMVLNPKSSMVLNPRSSMLRNATSLIGSQRSTCSSRNSSMLKLNRLNTKTYTRSSLNPRSSAAGTYSSVFDSSNKLPRSSMTYPRLSMTNPRSSVARAGSVFSTMGNFLQQHESNEEIDNVGNATFRWMLHIQDIVERKQRKHGYRDQDSTTDSSEDDSDQSTSTNNEVEVVNFMAFKSAIRQILPTIDKEEIVGLWNTKLKKDVSESISKAEFMQDFWLLGSVAVGGGQGFLLDLFSTAVCKTSNRDNQDPNIVQMSITIPEQVYQRFYNIVFLMLALVFFSIGCLSPVGHSTDMGSIEQLKRSIVDNVVRRSSTTNTERNPANQVSFESMSTIAHVWDFLIGWCDASTTHDGLPYCASPLQHLLYSDSFLAENSIVPRTITITQQRNVPNMTCIENSEASSLRQWHGPCVSYNVQSTLPFGVLKDLSEQEASLLCPKLGVVLETNYIMAFKYCDNLKPWIQSLSDGGQTFPGFGMSLDVSQTNVSTFSNVFEALKSHGWIDHLTREVKLDVVAFNRNIERYVQLTLHVAFSIGGGVNPTWKVSVVKTALNPAQPGWKGIAMVFVCAALVLQLNSASTKNKSSLKGMNLVDGVSSHGQQYVRVALGSWDITMNVICLVFMGIALGLVQSYNYSGLRFFLEEQTPGNPWDLNSLFESYSVLRCVDTMVIACLLVSLTSWMSLQRSTSFTYVAMFNACYHTVCIVAVLWIGIIASFTVTLRQLTQFTPITTKSYLETVGEVILTFLGSSTLASSGVQNMNLGSYVLLGFIFQSLIVLLPQLVLFSSISKEYYNQRSQYHKGLRQGSQLVHDWNISQLTSRIRLFNQSSDVKDRIVSRKVGEHGFEYFEERFDPGTGLKRGLANLGGFASHLASSQLEKFRI